jgi:hypothetical protein
MPFVAPEDGTSTTVGGPMIPTPPAQLTDTKMSRTHADLVTEIDNRISAIDHQLDAFAPLRLERDQLIRARRALLGDVDAQPGMRLSESTVLAVLREHPGSTTCELAARLGYGKNAVRAHLHRARQAGRCVAHDRGWYVAGPAAPNVAMALVADRFVHGHVDR